MRRKRLAGVVGGLGLIGLLFASGATVQAAPASSAPDLSTDSAVAGYLQSLGKDPTQFVILRGHRTYAGPNCPGGDTVCTTATNVVQVGDSNSAECTGTLSTPGTCTIFQDSTTTGNDNTAVCVENQDQTPATEVCDITQWNVTGNNRAIVRQDVDQKSGPIQDAIQFATVDQENGTGSNSLVLSQDVKQSSKESDSSNAQTQTANQYAGVDFQPITQVTAGGNNVARMGQDLKQDGKSKTGAAQDQDSNQVGALNQTDAGATLGGSSSNSVTQDQHQKLEGQGSQHQTVDPKCCSFQGTSADDVFKIRQTTDQKGDPQASQDAFSTGTCHTTGMCTVDQSSRLNGASQTNQCGPTTDCNTALVCTGSVEGSNCTPTPDCSAEGASCPPTPPCPPLICGDSPVLGQPTAWVARGTPALAATATRLVSPGQLLT